MITKELSTNKINSIVLQYTACNTKGTAIYPRHLFWQWKISTFIEHPWSRSVSPFAKSRPQSHIFPGLDLVTEMEIPDTSTRTIDSPKSNGQDVNKQ